MSEPNPTYAHEKPANKSSALEQALRENERLKAWARAWKAKAKANRGWARHEQWNREANAASAYWHMKRGDTYRKRAIALMHQSGQLRYLLCLSEAIAEFRVRDIDALRTQLEKAKAALKLYADHQNWDGDPNRDIWLPTNGGMGDEDGDGWQHAGVE